MTALTVPRYVPDYRVRIAGRDLPAGVRSAVLAVRYQNGLDAADRVELDVANPDLRLLGGHIRGLGVRPYPTGVRLGPLRTDVVPDGLFDIDNPLRLALGYADQPLADVFDGVLTGVEATLPASGMPTVTLVAHDRLVHLAEGTSVRGFGPLPDFLIAALLAGENALLADLDPAVVALSGADALAREVFSGTGRTQSGTSDLALLAEIAAGYDAHFWAEGDVVHLARIPTDTTPEVELRWGSSLVELAPRMSAVGQIVAVSARFALQWLPVEFVVTVGWDLDRESVSVTVRPGAAGGGGSAGGSLTVADQRIGGSADLVTGALTLLGELRRKVNTRLTATGSAVGDPRIRAGKLLRISAAGADFSGDYRVTEATHSLDAGGYRTSFAAQREIIP